MARNKTPKFAWRSFFAASSHDIWTIIAKALEIAAEDDPVELRKRRDGIVEQMYCVSSGAVQNTANSGEPSGRSNHIVEKRAGADGVGATLSLSPAHIGPPADTIVQSSSLPGVTSDDVVAKGIAEPKSIELGSNQGLEVERELLKVENHLKEDELRCVPIEADVNSRKHHQEGSDKSFVHNFETGEKTEKQPVAALGPHLYYDKDAEQLQAAIEEDSLRLQKILQLRPILSSQNKKEEDLVQAIASLGQMNVTVEELKATEIGKTVSALRKHPVKGVQSAAKQLVKLWKELVEDFQTVTDKISKKTSETPPEKERGLEAPPLDAATLASRNTSAELSQLLEDFTAEDLAAGLEKLSSTVAPSPRTEDGRLAFLSPVYGTREPPKLGDQGDTELDRSVQERFASLEASGLSLKEKRERVAGEKWHQAAKYDDIRPSTESNAREGETRDGRGKGEAEKSDGVVGSKSGGADKGTIHTSQGEGEKLKRLRSLEDDDIFGEEGGMAKKARVEEITGNKKFDLHRKEGIPNGSKASQDRSRSRTPELTSQNPAKALSPFRPTGSKQPGALPVGSPPRNLPGFRQPGDRPRSRTPELPTKVERPTLSPIRTPGRAHSHHADGHRGDSQKPLPKPRSATNFLEFGDAMRRATAPPRRTPEMRESAQKTPGNVEMSAHAHGGEGQANGGQQKGAESKSRKSGTATEKQSKEPGVTSDDDLFDELELLPAPKKPSAIAAPAASRRGEGRVDNGRSRNRSSVGLDSSPEPEAELEEEDGFLSDSEEEGGTVPRGPVDKLEETKRKLHEKYLQAENAKKSRTTVELKAGDLPGRRKALGHTDRNKARSQVHSKLSKLMRK